MVQRFRAGSDEEGVTPADTQGGGALYSPEMLSSAETLSRELMTRKPTPTPSLETLIAQKTPQYQKILGDTEGLSQAQMLFELGQRAFGFAGNVDDAGRPLRGGFFSRLAQASRTLPAAVGRHVAEIDKGQRQIKLLAMQAAEKDIDQVTAANQALTREQRALATEVIKGEARRRAEAAKALGASIFGKGDWEWSLVNQPNLLARWASGMTNPTEDGLIQSAITKLEQPTFYETVDPQIRRARFRSRVRASYRLLCSSSRGFAPSSTRPASPIRPHWSPLRWTCRRARRCPATFRLSRDRPAHLP